MSKRKIYQKSIAEKIHEARTGETVKRYKDGSIKTVPTVEVSFPQPEKAVLSDCLAWLSRRCLANRLNNGAMRSPDGSYAKYGITGGGDIICCYKGIHVEIECKAGKGGKLSFAQQERRESVERHEGVYLIVHSLGELQQLWYQRFEGRPFDITDF